MPFRSVHLSLLAELYADVGEFELSEVTLEQAQLPAFIETGILRSG